MVEGCDSNLVRALRIEAVSSGCPVSRRLDSSSVHAPLDPHALGSHIGGAATGCRSYMYWATRSPSKVVGAARFPSTESPESSGRAIQTSFSFRAVWDFAFRCGLVSV